jgi:hypothetical protein
MILKYGVSEKKKPCIHLRCLSGLSFHPSFEQAQLGLKTKTPSLLRQGFFFVAEGGFEPPTFGL